MLILMFLGSIFYIGYLFGQKGVPAGIGPKNVVNLELGKPSNVDFSLFWEAWNKLKEKADGSVDPEKMMEGAISGMLSSTNDPYTVYFTRKENQRFREDIQGEFDGIGVEIIQKNELPSVVAPLSGSPADKAGLKPNDVILEVDTAKTADIGFEETINKIRGKEGTKVKLLIAREGTEEPLTFEITREKIVLKSVEWSLKEIEGGKVGYIKIRQFGDDTEKLFAQAADELDKNKPKAIILDLRNDPGGYLETAVNLASYFIKDGVIVSEKGKNDNNKDYRSNGNGKLKKYKVVILVNEGSASASEILAGALKNREGSIIVGEKTFGKGSVQELIDLSDGSAVKITVAKWFTPNGRQINGQGIDPDIKVTDDEKTKDDEQLNRALEYLSSGK